MIKSQNRKNNVISKTKTKNGKRNTENSTIRVYNNTVFKGGGGEKTREMQVKEGD